jgi:hypothetical protein
VKNAEAGDRRKIAYANIVAEMLLDIVEYSAKPQTV